MSTKTCPSGTTLQANGLCGTGNTIPVVSGSYCGSQYTGKNCKYQKQLTPGMTATTGIESTNMICAFQEGDAQFPCDPGCCKESTGAEESEETRATEETVTKYGFPIWAIILLTVLGSIIFVLFLVWAAKKMSRKNR